MSGESLQSQLISLLNIIGYIATIAIIIRIAVDGWYFFAGISPALFRLGRGLAKRKIALFSTGRDLRNLLLDSKLFKEKNIVDVTKPNEIGRAEAEGATVYLMNWTEFADNVEQIIRQKKDTTPLVILAKPGSIPRDTMTKIGEARNTSVTNFRGRLLNDLVSAIITTGYQME